MRVPNTLAPPLTAALTMALIFGTGSTATASDDGITVNGEGREVSVASADVSIQLPGALTDTPVETSSIPPGLYRGEGDPPLSTAVSGSTVTSFATQDGVQTLIQIPDASSPSEYRFPLDLPEGGEAALSSDGAVMILDANGEPVSGFREPWAIDAEGNGVPTSFRVEGQELVQIVEFTASTVFPVLADPDLGVEWWGHWVRLTKGETRAAAKIIANNQGPAVLAGVACGALPGPAALGCGAAVALAYFKFVDPVNRASSAGKCVAINYPWTALSTPQIGWVGISVTIVNCTR